MNDLEYTILLVDNDPYQKIFIESMLKKDFTNTKVVSTNNANTAIDYIKNNNKVDIVLAEFRLAEANNYSLLKQIKDISNIPVLVQSTYSFNNEKRKCLEAGFNEYLLKPYPAQELIDKISPYLK